MEQLVANIKEKAVKRTLFGRDYLVANMVLIVPGVLNGSAGPLYYPPEEVGRNPEIWNHKPITLNHPSGSTNDPDILNSTQLGFLLNARYENDKLIAEGWFDVYRVAQVDQRILTNLRQGKPFELSTGLGVDFEKVENGEHNGVRYTAITRNYRPDHLAILLESVGACSIKDGCGVLVNEAGEQLTIGNALSHEQIRMEIHRSLSSLFKQDEPRPFIMAVFDGFFIYEQGEKLLKRSYSLTNDSVSITPNPVEVRKEVDFKPVSNIKRKGEDMAKEATVKELITNCDCWTDKHKDVLMNMDEEDVQNLLKKAKTAQENEKVANAAKAGFEDQDGKLVWNEKEDKWEKNPVENKKGNKENEKGEANNEGTPKEFNKETLVKGLKELTAEEWFEVAPPEVQEVHNAELKRRDEHKKELVEEWVENTDPEKKESAKAWAEKQSVETLEEVLNQLPKRSSNNPYSGNRRYNYAGAVGGVSNEGIEKPEPLGLPQWAD